jgi:predicted helicase
MPRIEPELQRLQEIKTLPSLLKYLKDDLNWPIESDKVEDVTFDYNPAELGFDSDSTAKIDEVLQLRPLSTNQTWGIFWVKFAKKKLPVQMLRRALGNLVVKKRTSTKKAERAAWEMHDLLFISAYGDDNNRHITFAHFSENEDSTKALPVLKVLGWDEDDTLLHLKDTYKTLIETLHWDKTPTNDPVAWRDHWSSAFKVGHREVINTTKELVIELAQLATVIKKSVLTSIKAETEKGPWKRLMLAFQKTLIKDLDEDQFADVIAQTVSYGLLTARLSSDGPISLKNLVDMVPSTNPFLKELLQHFLTSAGMKGLFDVDEAGINDVVELLNRANAQAIRNDFGKKTDGEDPVIHFYEHFLGAYNKKLKVERGVFYTPQPVVSYIVRSVHEILQKDFGLDDGLADTSTWAEVQKKNKALKIPEGIKDPKIEPFVQILDPATGTATFLIEVIELIHNTMVSKWDRERTSKSEQIRKWNTYVPTHLLPRLYAYELMMAPYAIAHMKVGLKLKETGFTAWEKLGPENRANIFLTNSLEPWVSQLDLPGFQALAHEASAVNEVKKNRVFTVVIGNPPYSGVSSNEGPWIESLLRSKLPDGSGDYFSYNGLPLNEPNTRWLNDDYVKFIRLSQAIASKSGMCIAGLITNHSWFENPTFRGMRQSTLHTFPQIHLLDLHGNSKKRESGPNGDKDENIFEIQQGVAISLLVSGNKGRVIRHAELFGSRAHKYLKLRQLNVKNGDWQELQPDGSLMLWRRFDATNSEEYSYYDVINEIFSPGNSDGRGTSWAKGLATTKDHLFVSFDKDEAIEKFGLLASTAPTDQQVGESLSLVNTPYFNIHDARKAIRSGNWKDRICDLTYRPFDTRTLYWHPELYDVGRGASSKRVMNQLFRPNIAIVTSRMTKGESFAHAFVTRRPVEVISLSSKTSNNAFAFPLKLYPASESQMELGGISDNAQVNLNPTYLRKLEIALNEKSHLPPEKVLSFIYAILYSHGYRKRYMDFLKVDFPRIPLPQKMSLFEALAKAGAELIALHLLESSKIEKAVSVFSGGYGSVIEKASYSNNTVWVNKSQTIGFKGVDEKVWNFHIGGYQVCEKWLKDRKDRKLTKDDVEHYHKIIVAISGTIRLMDEIDKVIEVHGGWPGAFKSGN